MSPWRRFSHRVLETLFPFPCFGCARPTPWRTERLGLCPGCQRRLPRPERACGGCGRPLPAGPTDRCGRCIASPPPWSWLRFAHSYEDPLPAIVHAMKFWRLEFLAEDLGRELAGSLPPDLGRACDVVVPVPLAWPRRVARGFNQAAAIARAVASVHALPVVGALGRRPRPRQARLGRRQRARNLRGSFRGRGGAGGARVLLVDDVVTTGATLDAATRALLAAGAASVATAVAARTPRDAELRPTAVAPPAKRFDSPL